MWLNGHKQKEVEAGRVCDCLASGFWYWSSILANTMAMCGYEAEWPNPPVRKALEQVLKKTVELEPVAVEQLEVAALYPYVQECLSPWETSFFKDWKAQTGGFFRWRFRRAQKRLARELWQYLKESDSFYLFLTECISNETESRAVLKLHEHLEKQGLLTEETLGIGRLLLILGSVMYGLQIDRVKDRLDEEGDFARMLRNTLREYRSVDQVAERTYEIYCTHFAAETGVNLGDNAYKVLLAKFVLDGEDHIYQVYEEGIRELRRKVWEEAEDAGEYREWMVRTMAENYAAFDFAHPMAYRFYLRAIERPLAEVLPLSEISLMFEQERPWESAFREAVHQAKLNTEKARFIQGDFAAEHLYLQGDVAFGHLQSGAEFEQYLKHIFTRLGYESELTKGSGDQGADLILRKNGLIFIVQAKYYEKPVGNKAVQEAVAALKFYGGNRAVVVTNNRFTKGAEALAKRNQVILQDGTELENLVKLAYSERALGHMF